MTGIEKLLQHFGTQVKAAKVLGVSKQAVNSWVKGRNRIPPSMAKSIEEKTGIPRSEFRPDLWEK